MSDSEDSTVTYTAVSSPFEDGSDIGSPGVDGPPIMPEDPYAYIMAAYQVPPSPDYIPGPEVPPSPNYIPGPEEPQSPPPLDFVPEPMYPEYIPQEDEILSAEEQPLPAAASPTADSPGYVPESDPKEEPEEDDEDPEEDPADYPADRDDDDDDDEEEEDEDEEEEEEHPAPADSVPPVHRMTARISIRDEPSISLPPREEVERLLALTTPPPSPLTPLSSPLPHIPSPPFPASPPASPIRPLGYRAAMIRLRAETPSTSHPLPLPTSSPLLQLLSSDHRTDRPEITLPPRKRLGIDLGPSSAAGAARQDGPVVAREDPYSVARGDLYGFVDMVDVAPRHPMSRELNYGITDTWDDLETTIMYDMMEDAQDDRSLLRARVNLLYRDRPVHLHLAVMIEREARIAHEAWGLSIDASDYARSDVMSLHTTVVAQSALISELQSANHRRQGVIKELWASDHKRQVQLTKALELLNGLQTQMAEFQRQLRPAKGLAQPDALGEAGSSS
ncbi:hypothetical protein Tco_1055937 [Tanacetum coccineum]|uniref:Uncharacterized protein n=1 Tax=Tanacetum coccineum TaxID=301880 RepID=A0ABQ5H1Q8_9ASTR